MNSKQWSKLTRFKVNPIAVADPAVKISIKSSAGTQANLPTTMKLGVIVRSVARCKRAHKIILLSPLLAPKSLEHAVVELATMAVTI